MRQLCIALATDNDAMSPDGRYHTQMALIAPMRFTPRPSKCLDSAASKSALILLTRAAAALYFGRDDARSSRNSACTHQGRDASPLVIVPQHDKQAHEIWAHEPVRPPSPTCLAWRPSAREAILSAELSNCVRACSCRSTYRGSPRRSR